MNTHNTCFLGEIKIISILLDYQELSYMKRITLDKMLTTIMQCHVLFYFSMKICVVATHQKRLAHTVSKV